ncbi:MAG: ATP-binding protein [Bacteroidota bacterium]
MDSRWAGRWPLHRPASCGRECRYGGRYRRPLICRQLVDACYPARCRGCSGCADAARSGSGSGLGLSMVRSLVEAMGGCVDAASSLGEGITMTAWLPLAQV